VDTVLIVLMLLACGAGLRAVQSGRLRALVLCALLVGLAFNTKTLAAYLVLPGLALAYALCAPVSIRRRAGHLLAATAVLAAVSLCWIAFVDLQAASARPFVGGSTDNSELGLAFNYNGLGRVGGQAGGPRNIPLGQGAIPHAVRHGPPPSKGALIHTTRSTHGPGPNPILGNGRHKNPIAFPDAPGPLRLFGTGLGDQGGWTLPLALAGVIGCVLACLGAYRRRDAATAGEQLEPAEAQPAGAPSGVAAQAPARALAEQPQTGIAGARRDPRLWTLLVLGGWFITEAAVLSFSKGIVHPYYASALAPASAAMAGAAVAVLAPRARDASRTGRFDGWAWRALLAVAAVAATVAAQLVLMRRVHYMRWFEPFLIAGAALGLVAMLSLPKLRAAALALTVCVLLVVPAAYAATTWLAPVQGTFPAAGPTQASGAGGVGVAHTDLRRDRALLAYVRDHAPGSRWALLTDASETAAPFILMGLDAGALAGYSGTDPALDGPGLARLVARRQARYVALGGEFSTRGGNGATAATLRACRQLPPAVWSGERSGHGLVLFDCAGRERALSSF
jgi:4-amino-4-deoxy-L-arabinose transferase-like glycosyltransferase